MVPQIGSLCTWKFSCTETQGCTTCDAIFRTSSCRACWQLSVSNWRWRRWAILLKSFAWLLDSLWSWPRGSTDVLKCLDIAPKSSFNMSIKLLPFCLNILFFNQDYHKDQSNVILFSFFLSAQWTTSELQQSSVAWRSVSLQNQIDIFFPWPVVLFIHFDYFGVMFSSLGGISCRNVFLFLMQELFFFLSNDKQQL